MMLKKLIFLLFFSIHSFGQYEIPNQPTTQKAVYQYKKILNDADENSLNQKLVKYADSTSTQIVIVSIDSTKGEDVLFLGAQWAQKWGIGQKELDNGILILIAVDDRKLSINTGYGVEEFLTDARSKRIIDKTISPNFKKSEYYQGLNLATDQIIEILAGNFDSVQETRSDDNEFLNSILFGLLVFLFMFFYPVIPSFREFKKRKKDGQDVIFWDIYRDYAFNDGGIYHPSGKFSSPFSDSGGGGSFGGGFGGGGFGGGGASGGW